MKIKFTFLLIITGLFLTIGFAQQNIEDPRQELEKTQEKIRAIQARIDALENQEKGVLNRIDAYDEKISLTKRLIRELETAQQLKENEISSVIRRINETQNKINTRRTDLEKLLVNLYKMKRIYPLEVILSERSIARVYQKSIYMRIVADDYKSQIQEFNNLKKALQLQQKQLVSATMELSRLKKQRETEDTNLHYSQSLERKILTKVRTEKQESKVLEDELRAAAAKLEKIITDLEKRRRERKLAPGTHYLEIMKGKLPWPYYGEVSAYFGSKENLKYNTKVRNTGIDIKCPADADIKAIAPGRVVYADRFMGYGNMIILDHGEGYYSVYSNLSEMLCSVRMDVGQVEVIGKSKDILHFELRSEGKPVDPLLWLSH